MQGWQPVLGHVCVGDHGDPGLRHEGTNVGPRHRQEVLADQNIVTARSQVDPQGIDARPGILVVRRHCSEFSLP